jgi:hypothetical protein
MCTVDAVTAPVVLAGPMALTQSPTARTDAAVVWVSDKVVDDAVVILSFSVLTAGLLVDFDFDFDVLVDGRKLTTDPESEMVELLTAATLPEAMVKLARPENDRLAPDGKLPVGGVEPDAERRKPPPNPPAPAPAPPAPKPDVHDPDDDGLVIVIERAAIVVLDFLDGVPVTVRQSPAATALKVSVSVSENVVVGVQLTEVCPEVVLCTSIVVPEMEATLPLAADLVGVAAPAPGDIARTTDAQSAATAAGTVQ